MWRVEIPLDNGVLTLSGERREERQTSTEGENAPAGGQG